MVPFWIFIGPFFLAMLVLGWATLYTCRWFQEDNNFLHKENKILRRENHEMWYALHKDYLPVAEAEEIDQQDIIEDGM
jgi:hypothetical protein